MLTRFALWLRLLFPLFAKVTLESKWLDRVREAASQGTLVHVVEVESMLDLALLNYLFLKHDLPIARTTNTRLNALLRPLLVLVFQPIVWLLRLFKRSNRPDLFVRETARGGTSLIFLKRARFVMIPGGNIGLEYLKALVRLQREQEKPIVLLPQVVFWSKGPEKYRKNVVDLLLGEPNAPGLRKFLTFLSRPSRTHVTCGEPVTVGDASGDEGEGDEETVARRLSWLIHRSIDHVQKITRGPLLKNAVQMKNEMLSNPDFITGVDAAAEQMGLSLKNGRKRATSNVMEIAADFRVSYIEFLSFVLTPIFKRVFSSFVVDRDAIQTIKEASKDSAVVLVPCHRSHIDYLVISYLMYLLGVNPPHIAAGANLSFFPMGHLFRHSGAFFIRRRIGGDKLYGFVLAQYIRKLLKEGHSIEYFIEGGRSRTGKTMMPKFGLLNWVADAIVGEAVREVKIIPIALTYERIMEVEGYARELAGKDKRKENLSGLVKSAEVLDSRYGRLYVTAGRPINAAEFFEKTAGKPRGELTETEKRYLVNKLGYLILGRINRATVVNPSALVAAVLLSHHRRGISKANFLEVAGFLLDFAMNRGYPISVTLERALKSSIHDLARCREQAEQEGGPRLNTLALGRAVEPILDEAVERFANQGHLETELFQEEEVLSLNPSSRIYLNYYRNNIIHVYQREALVAVSLHARRNQPSIAVEEVEDDVQYLSRLFKREFIFRVGDFERGIEAGLSALSRHGVVQRENGRISLVQESRDRLSLFRNMVLPIVESYLVCARYSSIVRWRGAMRGRDFSKAILERARKDYGEGAVTCQEALSTVSISNALVRYESMELLKTVESGIDAGKVRFSKGSALEDLAQVERELMAFVDRPRGG